MDEQLQRLLARARTHDPDAARKAIHLARRAQRTDLVAELLCLLDVHCWHFVHDMVTLSCATDEELAGHTVLRVACCYCPAERKELLARSADRAQHGERYRPPGPPARCSPERPVGWPRYSSSRGHGERVARLGVLTTTQAVSIRYAAGEEETADRATPASPPPPGSQPPGPA